MDIQEVISDIEDRIDTLGNITSEAEDKIHTIEDIRERATDANSSLQVNLDNLLQIQQNIDNIEDIVIDAESENLI